MTAKVLAILHVSPPVHGASKVGDFISSSPKIRDKLNIQFIPIQAASSIDELGKFSIKKLYLSLMLMIKIISYLISFRPNKIYFTSSSNGIAFYRDLIINIPIKIYLFLTNAEQYNHYHTKGISRFLRESKIKTFLLNFIFYKSNLLTLDSSLQDEYKKYLKNVRFYSIPNSVEDPFKKYRFEKYLENKFLKKNNEVNFLFMSNMIESKGYKHILRFASNSSDKEYRFNFAGAWQDKKDKEWFFNFLSKNNLENKVTYHGLVGGKQKKKLFEEANIFLFPTRYPKEAFPLCILEAFSYGLPAITSDEGSLVNIIKQDTGHIIFDLKNFDKEVNLVLGNLLSMESSKKCRNHYLENFSPDIFEDNFIDILS